MGDAASTIGGVSVGTPAHCRLRRQSRQSLFMQPPDMGAPQQIARNSRGFTQPGRALAVHDRHHSLSLRLRVRPGTAPSRPIWLFRRLAYRHLQSAEGLAKRRNPVMAVTQLGVREFRQMNDWQKWIISFGLTAVVVAICYVWLDRPIALTLHHYARQFDA